jgi:hypothetical protein
MPIQTFWTEATGRMVLGLRRFTFSDRPNPGDGRCPSYGFGHNSKTMIGEAPERRNERGNRESVSHHHYRGDSRWPLTCEHCSSYSFTDDDQWQVWTEAIYRSMDGREWPQRDLPPGALYDAWWLPDSYKGADGIHLAVTLPTRNSPWFADGPATGGGRWTRTGDPRNPANLSISPSIAAGDPNKPDHYHSWLGAGGVPVGCLGDP